MSGNLCAAFSQNSRLCCPPVQANETKMFSVDEKRTVLVLLKLFLFLLADAELSGYAYQWRTLAQKHV